MRSESGTMHKKPWCKVGTIRKNANKDMLVKLV